MAIKITLAAALLVALVALATATSYTTTVTTTTSEDEASSPRQQQECQREIQGRRFRSCQRYLSQQQDEEKFIEMSTGKSGQQEEQQEMQQCCEQLRNVNEQCRCEAIKQAMRQMPQPEMGQSQQQQQVIYKAMNLPRMCNMRPHQCQIRVVVV